MVTQQEISEMIQRIKQEPADEDLASNSKFCNGTAQKRKQTLSEEFSQTGQKRFRNLPENGKPSIPCLMCDRYLENQDELMIHMALDHQCSPQGNRRQTGRIPKHSCQICFAKFRTLRDLFTHTAFHAKQMQINGEWASDIGSRIEKSLVRQGTIRQYFSNIQNNLQADVQHGTFKCDCCNNVFMNRDTYAMHVMMRVKDEMCKHEEINKAHVKGQNGDYGDVVLIPPQNGQEYLIDVTSSAIEDEYLKSALSVTENQQTAKLDAKCQQVQGRKCMFCTEHFTDQDTMAMHVMSVHTNDSRQKLFSRNFSEETIRHTESKYEQRNVVVKDVFSCKVCGNIFESRDSLAMHLLSRHTDNQEHTSKPKQLKKNVSTGTIDDKSDIAEDTDRNIQEEPLNLVSGKKILCEKNQRQSAQKSNEKLDRTKCEFQVEKVCPGSVENKDIIRRSRSVSLPNESESDVLFVTRNRPASTGGITSQNINTQNQNIEQSNSAVSYIYEQPDPYIEDREHLCQSVRSPQSDPLELLLQRREHAHVCSYCEIIFLNRTLYYLHMGLHNVNNPLQCNMCGKTCDNIHDFSAHIMHL